MTQEKIEINAVFNVSSTGDMEFHDAGKAFDKFEPGTYAVVPYSQVVEAVLKIPKHRVFHLGDLRGLGREDLLALCAVGISNSDEVRALGVLGLEKVPGLSEKAIEKLVSSFSSLGIPIPEREGGIPVNPVNSAILWAMYEAHLKVWEYKEELSAQLASQTVSSFIQHAAGFDIVCGKCGDQYLGVSETEAKNLVCKLCGNNVGTDLEVLVESRPRFIKENK